MENLMDNNMVIVDAKNIMNMIRSKATMTISHSVVMVSDVLVSLWSNWSLTRLRVESNFGNIRSFVTMGVVRNLVNANGGWPLVDLRLCTVMSNDEMNASIDIRRISFKYPSTKIKMTYTLSEVCILIFVVK